MSLTQSLPGLQSRLRKENEFGDASDEGPRLSYCAARDSDTERREIRRNKAERISSRSTGFSAT